MFNMNNIKVVSFDIRNAEKFEKAKKVRQAVFIQEQYLDQFLEYDGLDRQSALYLVLEDEKAIGTARWRTTYDGIKLERFAILKDYRNKNVGKYLLEKILKDIQHMDMDVYLHACVDAVKFFEQKGFIIEGEKFTEVNVEHYKMILN